MPASWLCWVGSLSATTSWLLPELDDRRNRAKFLAHAEELMADAVGADTAFFSTCGSSLSVKAAMMAVAGGSDGGLLVARDSHKSIVAGLIFSGVRPRWITPRWDSERHFSHPPSPQQVEAPDRATLPGSRLTAISPRAHRLRKFNGSTSAHHACQIRYSRRPIGSRRPRRCHRRRSTRAPQAG